MSVGACMAKHRQFWTSLLRIALPVAIIVIGWAFYQERSLAAHSKAQQEVVAEHATSIAVTAATVERLEEDLEVVDARTQRIESAQSTMIEILKRVEEK